MLCTAHKFLGQALIWRAQCVEARKHLEFADSYYDESDCGELGLTGVDAPAAIVVLLLGFPDRARELMKQALRPSERRARLRSGSGHDSKGAERFVREELGGRG